ncbi:MAG: excinuclease ABC subunit UvrA [Pseudomonadota bacterium]|nr:excinuclease ABC subunit UvrA [Pseudomonadota bacterium]
MTESQHIEIRGAKTHNLKNVSIDIPRKQLVVITGISGSGKSSLAFDTLFAEGQRRYVQSLSTYARQFVDMMEKPDVESISGLSPAISIEQKAGMHNPRSTVGTVTEIYDYLRLLYARAGESFCPEHNLPLNAQTVSQIIDQIFKQPIDTKLLVLAPILKDKKGEHKTLLSDLRKQGFIRVMLNNTMVELDELESLPSHKKNNLSVVIDRLKIKPDHRQRLAESIETALPLSQGTVLISYPDLDQSTLFSTRLACAECGFSIPDRSPKMFSFNSPDGACPTCDGLGIQQTFDVKRLIPNPDISIANGAIAHWDKPVSYYYQLLVGLAKHYEFDLNTPWSQLPDTIQHIVLHGSGTTKIPYRRMGLKGRFKISNKPFEGVLNTMHRRYLETESDIVRAELAHFLSPQACPSCHGSRLCAAARHTFIAQKDLHQLGMMAIKTLAAFFQHIQLSDQATLIAAPILREIQTRIDFLIHVGLDYLSLSRPAETLSGGEAQRIRLASQIGSGLTGVMYILDEPSIGLHQRDNQKLITTLFRLKSLGNTVVVVEHDEETMLKSDYLIDIGPGAGIHGGNVVAEGKPQSFIDNPTSLTGQYLSGQICIQVPSSRKPIDPDKCLTLTGVSTYNLADINVSFPVGLMIGITGVSGSGKSSLINKTLYPALHNRLDRYDVKLAEGTYQDLQGSLHYDKIIQIDQSPIGRTPRSNPATYTGMFNLIRDLFAQTPESRARGYTPGRFSFNVKGGRCEACQGDGLIKVEMHFLADVYVECKACLGKRYNGETLEVRYKGKNIHEVLNMSTDEALEFFQAVPNIARKLQTLIDVGLDYIKLGQSATTLSGGEAQRLKLSRELAKRDTGRTLYILDEPTTGLHFHDVNKLLQVLYTLRDHGNTVMVIEHNLDVIKTVDWIIDIGPEGGDGGGHVVAEGTPEQVAMVQASHTGRFLAPLLPAK